MNLEDLLAEFGRQTGTGQVALDENQACRLVFDDQWVVDLELLPGAAEVLLHMRADVLPAEGRESYYRRLLEANLFGAGTGGAAFAVDPNTDDVLLCERLKLERTDYQAFVNCLENLVNRAVDWHDRLNPASAEDSQPEAQAGEQSPHLVPSHAVRC